MPFKLLAAVLTLAMFACGCAANVGALSATSWGFAANVAVVGRAEPSLSLGWEVQVPLESPEKKGEWGLEMALPYEEFVTNTRDVANLPKGRLRSQSAGVLWRLLYVRNDKPAKKYVWFGAGPEYRWNAFVVSDRSIVYEENVKDAWGWCICGGYDFLPSGILVLELSYHWFQTRTVVKGVSGGIPFKWSRGENMQWLSCFLGFRLRF